MYIKSFALLGVDHVVIQTKDVEERRTFFSSTFGFSKLHDGSDELTSGDCRLRLAPLSDSTTADSVTDVCIIIQNLQGFVDHVKSICPGVLVDDLAPSLDERRGPCKKARIKSIVGNVFHTLVETEDVTLPLPKESIPTNTNGLIGGFDHITFACRIGETTSVLQWYEDIFGMRSFDFGDSGNGFIVKSDDIGMKLTAMEFWMCAEKGLAPVENRSFPLIVVAEPLPGMDPNNQIDIFIHDHGGPGIQHIGLKTSNICTCKTWLKKKGVKFIEPPPTYYSEIGKLKDILKAGENPDELQLHGILIDHEEDLRTTNGIKSGYLMQAFTKPLFDERTFFLELIERRGARGFGAGNITALFKAVQAYMKMSS